MQGKHLVVAAGLVAGLISATPSEATLIGTDIDLVLQVAGVLIDPTDPNLTIDLPVGQFKTEFTYVNGAQTYSASFTDDLLNDVSQLTLTQISTGSLDYLDVLWTFGGLHWKNMPGEIEKVEVGSTDDLTATVNKLSGSSFDVSIAAIMGGEPSASSEVIITPTAGPSVPEPGTLLLLGAGLLGLSRIRRRD